MKPLLAAIALIFSGIAVAENPLSVKLVSEDKAIAAGKTFTLGIHLKPPAGYHTYWKHPGIVGLATSVEWDLPSGFTADEIQWPAPETVKMARYTAQGYRGETLLMVPITPPPAISTTSVTLTARVSWMCCGPQCHPASKVPLTITLPVAPTNAVDPAQKPLFDRFREQLPAQDDAWNAEFTREQEFIILTLKPKDPALTRDANDLGDLRFFTADGQIDSDKEQKVTRGPGQQIRMELPLSKQSKDQSNPVGVITAEKSWQKDVTSTALKLSPN
ncbi:protein-disulfide reductase DsbD family protein [Luteolibacter flavescens]|uniref:Protein-disulfide reductase DsbD family protein n=1 Tax=Luteolibacter flavescens TaxID=1859460 RepID=A0ABT3FW83_9BACT|nr:protein-disulfide reductase DsbD domain-containing protein [Luteolibacter flavescens]MCW1887662.1 protein-disulfide reductase DsbD family protein [Luteolibacter flavescens]